MDRNLSHIIFGVQNFVKLESSNELEKKFILLCPPIGLSSLDMSRSRSLGADYSSASRSPSNRRTVRSRSPHSPGNALVLRAPARQRGPELREGDDARVDRLFAELNVVCAAHARFQDVDPLELREAADCFIRYRFRSLDAIKRSTKEARKFFLDDLRKIERKSFPDVALIIELFDHLPVNPQTEQADDKVRFTEVDIPRALINLAPSLAGLTGLFRPDQLQVNWVAKELAKGLAKIPPFTPYLVPKLSSAPRVPDMTERRSSIEKWCSHSKQAKRRLLPQELPVQAWILYHFRFLMAAECCGAFRLFGGLSAQFNLFSIVLNLCVAENVNLGLSYFRILSARLEEFARMRVIAPGEFSSLLNTEQLDVKEQARREMALSLRGNPVRAPRPPFVPRWPGSRPIRSAVNRIPITPAQGAHPSQGAQGAPTPRPPFTPRRGRQSFNTQNVNRR